jgi:hypothetical protein
MLQLTAARAAAWRACRHHLDRREPAHNMLAVARRLCGLHAQLMSSAELTLWARVEGLDRGSVQRALWQDRTLVKTWAMRGTLHLLPSAELPLWRAALRMSPRYLRPAAWRKYFGLSLPQLGRMTEAIGAALNGRVLTREELAPEVARIVGSKSLAAKIARSSWGTMLKPAAFAGHLCFGPSEGQRVRFTRPDTWLAAAALEFEPADAQTATLEVARRFLAGYGPATCHDLGRWWNGGGVSTPRRWIAALGAAVTEVDLDGEQAWMLTSHVQEIRELPPARCVRLLPAFDQYAIGASFYVGRLLPAGIPRNRIFRPQGWVSPVLLVNGLMRGTWRHELKGSRVDVTIEPFIDLPARVCRAAGAEAERLAEYFGCALSLVWRK